MIFVGIIIGLVGLGIMVAQNGYRPLGIALSAIGGFIIGQALGQMLLS